MRHLKRIIDSVWLSASLCAIVTAALGLTLLMTVYGDRLTMLSFDLPFLRKPVAQPDNVVLVKMNNQTDEALGVRSTQIFPRDAHAQMLMKLKDLGAKMVVFDIVFAGPSEDPVADQALADAIRAHGGVILAGYVNTETDDGSGMLRQQNVPPYELFATNALGWGVEYIPIEPDFAIRRQESPTKSIQTLAWAAAKGIGAVTEEDRDKNITRWVNYYGPRDAIQGFSYDDVLFAGDDMDPSAGIIDPIPDKIRGKIVFIGQHYEVGRQGALKDDFVTPYSATRTENTQAGPTPGVEVQATMFLNLVHREWLTRMPPWLEVTLILTLGIGCGLGFHFMRSWIAARVGLIIAILLLSITWHLFRHEHIWFSWLICLVQIGVATLWSAASNSARLYVDRSLLAQSISSHIAPGRVDQILKQVAVLKPGGKDQQVSILFSDIAGFSGISEKLDPEDLFKLLNQYYATALESVHEQEGTVIQLIGDAIYAVWNAPLEQPDHKVRACRAALNLHKRLVKFNSATDEFPLHTRVGVHSGVATVGNLGSSKRFEYTCIGDSVNLSSRLESLNKHVGTDMLATRTVQRAVEDEMVTRLVGHFVFKGFGRPVEVYELIGNKEIEEPTRAWRETFSEAVKQYRAGAIAVAKELFKKVIEQRKESDLDTRYEETAENDDGPSLFYLSEIQELGDAPLPEVWNGDIVMTEK
ncbi:MAG: adenylate cyclase [Verrucomicrobiales bacterium]|jgi:adenylate cyclase